jgi:hypothetical protein
MNFLPCASYARCIAPFCTGLGSSCGEYIAKHYFVLLIKSENMLLNIFFMQLSKRETRAYTMCLPSPFSHMGDTPLSRVSPFSSYWRHAYYRCVSHFIAKGDELLVASLALIQKWDALQTDTSPFILPHPAWYRSLVPPRTTINHATQLLNSRRSVRLQYL